MTQPKPMHITAMMLAVFCLSFGILWRQRHQAAPPAPQPGVVSAPPPAPTSAVLRAQAGGLLARPPASGRLAIARPSPAADAPAADDGGEPLPVIFNILHKPDYFRDRSTNYESVRKEVNEGVVSTTSSTPLTLTVIETDVRTQQTSQFSFDLAWRAQRHFGMHDGLQMSSGDQLTLRSPPYRDLVQQIP